MRFSILIPVFNTSAYLVQCMESVLTQSFTDYEVVIVDDGSTDNSGQICDSYTTDPRVRVFHTENQGLLMARRTGIAKARGEFCVFVDSDDALMNGALESINKKLCHTMADILIYNTALVYNDDFSNPVPRKPVFTTDKVFIGEEEKLPIYEKLLEGFELNNLVLKAIRTQLVKEDDTDYFSIKDKSMGEDLAQTLYPITQAQRVAYTGECYYYYRQNNSSMTHEIILEKLDRRFTTYNPYLMPMKVYYAKLWGLWDDEHKYLIYRAALRNVRNLFNSVFLRCKDWTTRKKWCDFPWEELLPVETMEAMKERKLGLGFFERTQLQAILNHYFVQLYIMAVMQKIVKR